MRSFARTLFLATALVAGAGLARAEVPVVRKTGITRKADKLVVSVGLQDLFTAKDLDRLLSGFSTRVLIRVALLREDGGPPVAQVTRLAEIVYDLWDEKLRLRISSDRQDKPNVLVVPTPRAAADAAASLIGFPVADGNKLDPAVAYYLSMRADLNPISEELVTNVRRWLSRPSGRSHGMSGDNFFGSFVSVFVNPRVSDSERVLQVQSQVFTLPASPSP
jgi:hypothetical protein